MPVSLPRRPFGAVAVAMVTPFTAEGALDVKQAQALAARLVADGCQGLVVSGTTGESPTTTDAEKETLIRAVVEAVGGRAKVVAGVGTYDTAQSVDLARQAEKAGAHGLLAVTPYYSKPPQEGLIAHFTAIADATDLPVMLYDIPGRSGIAIHTDTTVRLAEHPRIVAVKDAKADLYEGAWLMRRADIAVYSGDDSLTLPWIAQGACGVVSVIGHVATPQIAAMISAVDAGDLATAQALNTRLLPAVRGIMTITQGAIMAKAAAQLAGTLPNRTVRLPLVAATDDQVALLRADLEEADLL